jgi:hypothetical protein
MAIMLGIILATLGVVFCIAAGLLLLLIPRWKQLAPYAFLVYPSAYFSGLFSFFVFGLFVNSITDRYSHSNLVAWIGVQLMFGLTAMGALAGAISGFALANGIWWRFFARPGQLAARPQSPSWLALTPFMRKLQARLLHQSSRVVGNPALWKRAQAATSQDRDKYQKTA